MRNKQQVLAEAARVVKALTKDQYLLKKLNEFCYVCHIEHISKNSLTLYN
jgi:hypothetical protein